MDENVDSQIINLPEEIILKILSYCDLNAKILLNFGATCKKFHDIIGDSILWKKQLGFRYPKISEVILLHGSHDYYEQYQYVKKTENKLLKELKDLSSKYFWHSIQFLIEDAETFFKMCGERNISLSCIHSLLVDIHSKSGYVIESDYPSTSPYTLTTQYYATFIIRYVMHIFLMMVWRSKKLTLTEISPEWILDFYINWTDTFIYTEFSVVKNLLDELTRDVEGALSESHPLRSMDPQTRAEWAEGPLLDNQWSSEDNHSVHAAVRRVLYNQCGLRMERSVARECLHLPSVIKNKKGHMIALAVLYSALARRCGVKTIIVTFPDHFFLDWRESFTQPCSPVRYSVMLDSGRLERKSQCPYASSASAGFREYNPESLLGACIEESRRSLDVEKNATVRINIQALEEVLHGLEGNMYTTKFMTLIGMAQMTKLMVDNKSFSFGNIDTDYRSLMVQLALPPEGAPPNIPKPRRTVYRNRRSTHVQFAVGMVCAHRVYNYRCVVTGWDPACAAPAQWQARMGVQALAYKDQQPFYNVCAADGSSRYVAQENLTLLVGQRQPLIEDVIGKEFSHFNGTYYIPNAEKQKEYPDEQQVIAAYRRAPTMLMSTCKLMKAVPGHMQFFNWR